MKLIRHLLLIAFSLLGASSFGQSNDTIFYNKRDKISWSDFQGTPVDSLNYLDCDLGTTLAMWNVKVDLMWGTATFEATGVVYPSRSGERGQADGQRTSSSAAVF